MEMKSSPGLNQSLEDIKKGKLFPVYLIFGDENYTIKEAAQKIIEALLPGKDRAINLETVDGDEEDWGKIIQSLNTYPMFGARKVIVVKDTKIFYSKFMIEKIIEKSKERFEKNDINEAIRLFRTFLGYLKIEDVSEINDKKQVQLKEIGKDQKSQAWLNRMLDECLAQNLAPIPYPDNSDQLNDAIKIENRDRGIPQGNVLILAAEYVDKRKKLYKTINDIGVTIDFSIQRARRDPADVDQEERRTLQQQADELLKQSGKKLTKDGFDALLNKTGFNIGVFLNELGKVILSIKDSQKIGSEDVEKIVGRTKEDSIFDLQKAVGQKDFEKAVFYLEELLGQGEFYLNLLQSIANEIRYLIAAKVLIEDELKDKWNPKLSVEAFKKYIYFPIILRIKKEKDSGVKKSRYNILNRPPDVLMELLKGSENFTREELYRSMSLLAETDLKLKSVGVLPVHLLEKAIMDICSSKGDIKRFASLKL